MLSVTIASVCVPRKIIDYTVTCLEPTVSTNIWYCDFILLKSLPPGALAKSFITDQISFLTPDVLFIQPLVSRRNNFPGECLAMRQSSVPLSKSSSLDHTHGCLTHARSCDKGLPKERIINKSWILIITSLQHSTNSVWVGVLISTVWPLPKFYIEPFISLLFAVIKTLRVSCLDTPSFDAPVVTGLGEGARQKILIRQVFNRCVIVWDR